MSSAYPILLWWSRECVLYLIIIIKPEVWIINHCLGLGHETMVCAVCLTMFFFLLRWHLYMEITAIENCIPPQTILMTQASNHIQLMPHEIGCVAINMNQPCLSIQHLSVHTRKAYYMDIWSLWLFVLIWYTYSQLTTSIFNKTVWYPHGYHLHTLVIFQRLYACNILLPKVTIGMLIRLSTRIPYCVVDFVFVFDYEKAKSRFRV